MKKLSPSPSPETMYDMSRRIVIYAAATGAIVAFMVSWYYLTTELYVAYGDVVVQLYRRGYAHDLRPWQVAFNIALFIAAPLGAIIGAILSYPLAAILERIK